MIVLVFVEYGWEEGDSDTFEVIWVFEDEVWKEQQDTVLDTFYKERGYVRSYGTRTVDGQKYDIHGDIREVKVETLNQLQKYGF